MQLNKTFANTLQILHCLLQLNIRATIHVESVLNGLQPQKINEKKE
jgi:hypothetical protein